MKKRDVFLSAIVLITAVSVNWGLAAVEVPIGIGAKEEINLPYTSFYVYNSGPSTKTAIRTNSTVPGAIAFGNGHTINADVVVGPGGDPGVVINNPGASITGNIYAADVPIPFYEVLVPPALSDLPNQGNINTNTVITTSGKFNRIDLGNQEILTINGDVDLFITDGIVLSNSSWITINPGSSLTLYFQGNLLGGNSNGFNNLTNSAANLRLFALSSVTDIRIKNAANWYGTIYAPNADVILYNAGDIYGAIAANSFFMRNAGSFYYDASIPEPATMILFALGGLLLLRFNRQEKQNTYVRLRP